MICQRCYKPVYTGGYNGPVDIDGFQTVLPNANRKLAAMVVLMVKQFNAYWLEVHHMSINFHFGVEEYPFITFTEPALLRNDNLMAKMESMGIPMNPVIVEPFAGCGADTITFLYSMKPRKVYVCDRDLRVSELLEDNVDNFQVSMDYQDNRVDYTVGEAKNIYNGVAESGDEISLLYLDPPWVLDGVTGKGSGGEADAGQLIQFLVEQVFQPMKAHKLIPKLIVVKTRFDWKELSKVMDKLPTNSEGHPQYVQTDTIFFKPLTRTVYFHTLQSTNVVLHHWEHSRIQDKVYPRFKEPNSKYGNIRKDGELKYIRTVET
jgi:hypothetical protein